MVRGFFIRKHKRKVLREKKVVLKEGWSFIRSFAVHSRIPFRQKVAGTIKMTSTWQDFALRTKRERKNSTAETLYAEDSWLLITCAASANQKDLRLAILFGLQPKSWWWWQLFPHLQGFWKNVWPFLPHLCFFFFKVEISSHTHTYSTLCARVSPQRLRQLRWLR